MRERERDDKAADLAQCEGTNSKYYAVAFK